MNRTRWLPVSVLAYKLENDKTTAAEGSSPDPAHLLVAVVGMDLGFQPNALGHRLGDGPRTVRGVAVAAHEVADRHFAALEEAASQNSIRRQTQAIARRAERLRHGADEADSPARIAVQQSKDLRRADAGLGIAIDRHERAKPRFNPRSNIAFTDERITAILRATSTGGTGLRRMKDEG